MRKMALFTVLLLMEMFLLCDSTTDRCLLINKDLQEQNEVSPYSETKESVNGISECIQKCRAYTHTSGNKAGNKCKGVTMNKQYTTCYLEYGDPLTPIHVTGYDAILLSCLATITCAEITCQNGGNCVKAANLPASCQCSDGYTGQECETNVDECTDNIDDCDNNASCFDTDGSYTCQCNTGYQGNGKACTDIPDCPSPNPCHNGGVCVDGVNTYSCSCGEGWGGNNCLARSCHKPSIPHSTISPDSEEIATGSYTVTCDYEYTRINAPAVVTCTNGILSALPSCVKDRCLRKKSDLLDDTGAETEDLENLSDKTECIRKCREKTGAKCNGVTMNLDDNKCYLEWGNDANLTPVKVDDYDTIRMSCLGVGDTGGCSDVVCQNGGTCVNAQDEFSSPYCKCPTATNGDNCEISACSGGCQNGGTCAQDELSSFYCKCPTGYNGTNCENNKDDCSQNMCESNEKCVDLLNAYACECKDGFEGQNCDKIKVDGNWNEWSAVDDCSCTRTRTCTNPAPAYNGKGCLAKTEFEHADDVLDNVVLFDMENNALDIISGKHFRTVSNDFIRVKFYAIAADNHQEAEIGHITIKFLNPPAISICPCVCSFVYFGKLRNEIPDKSDNPYKTWTFVKDTNNKKLIVKLNGEEVHEQDISWCPNFVDNAVEKIEFPNSAKDNSRLLLNTAFLAYGTDLIKRGKLISWNDLQYHPLEIETNTAFSIPRNHQIAVDFYHRDDDKIGHIRIDFSTPPRINAYPCTNWIQLKNYDGLTQKKKWTIRKTSASIVIECNGVEVFTLYYGDGSSTCGWSPYLGSAWKKNVVKIAFREDDTVSLNYSPIWKSQEDETSAVIRWSACRQCGNGKKRSSKHCSFTGNTCNTGYTVEEKNCDPCPSS